MISKVEFYPPELQLTCEDKSDQEVNYLDLHLKVTNSTIEHRLFNPSYGVFISQLVRYARCCQKFVDFKLRTISLVNRLLKQNFKFIKLCKTFKRFSSKYNKLLRKYSDFRCYDLSILFSSNLIKMF